MSQGWDEGTGDKVSIDKELICDFRTSVLSFPCGLYKKTSLKERLIVAELLKNYFSISEKAHREDKRL